MLGRKQNLKPEDEHTWWTVVNSIEDYVTREECEEKTRETIDRIRRMQGKIGYSWSGGKDSLVLSDICQSIGVTTCQMLITDLEYPAWRKWMEENKPDGCEAVYVGYGLDFLKEHPEMIFAKGREKQKWNRLVQRSHFLSFMEKHNLDVCCIGHRTIDGNCCGKDGVVKRGDKILFAPLHDWSHEMVFAYMHYHGIDLPFIYRWYRGFFQGTHWWAYRYADTVEQGFDEVYDIDPTVIEEAAKILPQAKEYLKRRTS